MDDLAARLLAVSRDREPPAGLAERISRDAARQGRRRRAVLVAAGTALTVVAVVLAVDALPRNGAGPLPAVRTTTTTTTTTDTTDEVLHQGLVRGPAPRTSTLTALFPGRAALQVPRKLRDGRPFRAFELTPAGALLGVDQSYDASGMDRWSETVLLDPLRGNETVLPVVDLAEFSSDGRYVTWLEHTDPADKFNLLCRDLPGGTARQLSDGSVWEGSVVSDGGRVAWTYYAAREREDREVSIAAACAGPERVLPVRGYTVALRGRYLYLVDKSGRLLRHNLDSAVTQPIPLGAPTGQLPMVAVGPDSVLWSPTDDEGQPGQLRARQLATGRDVLVAAAAPRAERGINGSASRVSAGNRLLAFSSSPIDGPPGNSRGLVYDPVTNSVLTLPGEVFAAGDWLLWLQDDGYRLLDVS